MRSGRIPGIPGRITITITILALTPVDDNHDDNYKDNYNDNYNDNDNYCYSDSTIG